MVGVDAENGCVEQESVAGSEAANGCVEQEGVAGTDTENGCAEEGVAGTDTEGSVRRLVQRLAYRIPTSEKAPMLYDEELPNVLPEPVTFLLAAQASVQGRDRLASLTLHMDFS